MELFFSHTLWTLVCSRAWISASRTHTFFLYITNLQALPPTTSTPYTEGTILSSSLTIHAQASFTCIHNCLQDQGPLNHSPLRSFQSCFVVVVFFKIANGLNPYSHQQPIIASSPTPNISNMQLHSSWLSHTLSFSVPHLATHPSWL